MGSCCGITTRSKATVCLECRAEGKPVGLKTLQHLVIEEKRGAIGDGNYYFCATPDCPVVYYNAEGSVTFHKEDLTIKVGLKETDPTIPVCYCFNITEEDIREEIRKTGRSTASQRIRSEIKARSCACEINNPSGRCCLGDVGKVEKRLLQERRNAA